MTLIVLFDWIGASLLLSLRIAPVLTFAPPFSLFQLPATVRILLGLGVSALMVAGNPALATGLAIDIGALAVAAVGELMLGLIAVIVLQLTFAALYVAGRTVDIQAGFGLALLIDPASRAQTPLIGTIFVYAAGAIFFAMNGHHDLLRILSASLDAMPLGFARLPESPMLMLQFATTIFVAGLGVAGIAILCLFLTDIAVAILTRTLPQMNPLILGFQVKTIVLLLVLPLGFGVTAVLLAQMIRLALEHLPRLL